jgi:NADPH-dependent 2,4-dienoyl-CoA reductase/sulfur reductase-like enzyme
MEAARVLKERGHQVALWEKDRVLGGQLHLAAVPVFKKKIAWLIDFLTRRLETLGVECRLDYRADPDRIREFNPDEIILATGSRPAELDLPGLSGPGVSPLEEVLREDYSGADRTVTVLGGGFKGAELALFLAGKGERVTVVEMRPEIAPELEPATRQDLLDRLGQETVRLLTGRRVVACRKGEVEVAVGDGEAQVIPGEVIVPCLGNEPVNHLAGLLDGWDVPVHLIGDCRRPGMIIEAISQAYATASRI